MLSIRKNEPSLNLQAGKRLKVFEKITGAEPRVEITRNLQVTGVDPTSSVDELEKMFRAIGDLHVFDTQQLAKSELIISYFDVRHAKNAFSVFSPVFSLAFLPDPPVDDFNDILYIYVESGDAELVTQHFGQGAMHSAAEEKVLWFKYYDLRTKWTNQHIINSIRVSKASPKPEARKNYKAEDKENIAPGLGYRKNAEILTHFVISLENIIQGMDLRTTLMIKNIPNKYSQTMLIESINRNHAMTFDFIYLPIDFKNRCNVGYAFINFVDFRYIPRFYKEFDGKKWEKFNSEKVCALSYARIQGRANLEKHFQSSSIMVQEKAMRPVILASFNV
jgi:hypothetical protein